VNKDLIILDRDGCINIPKENLRYVFKEHDFELFDDVIPFITDGLKSGIKFAIATNQQGISKGLFTLENVHRLHEILISIIGIRNIDFPIYVCPHSESIHCECRKPRPLLLVQAMAHFKVAKERTVFIGDSDSDFEAASGAGIDFLYLDRTSSQRRIQNDSINSLSIKVLDTIFT
jgi:D-glycero-D-manno-heptose 1,7-bisphosphate phosphatase